MDGPHDGPGLRILVLREGGPGLSSADYADELRRLLPDHQVLRATTAADEREFAGTADVIAGFTVDEAVIDAATDLSLFACSGTGAEHVPVERLRERGAIVTVASGMPKPNMAEHAIAGCLFFARRFGHHFAQTGRREWHHVRSFGELAGATVTIVGLGAIGRATAERLRAFDATTIGVRYTPSKGGPTDEVVGYEPDAIDDALARSDYVILACPETETTRGLIDASALATLSNHAVLVNVARGGVVDTPALVTALQRNQLRGALLDVTDPEPLPAAHPLWGLDSVLITSHSAGHSPHWYRRRAGQLAANVGRFEETGSFDGAPNLA